MHLLFFKASAQIGSGVSSICHTEVKTTKIKITDDIDPNSLQVFEKLKFLKKKITTVESKYFNADGNYNSSTKFISHENAYPAWYVPASETISTESGMLSYYEKDNKYLTGGWPGGAKITDTNVEYGTDKETRKRYGFKKYSNKERNDFNTFNREIQKTGLLSFYSFYVPNKNERKDFEREGYRVYTSKEFISIENNTHSLVWNLNNYSLVQKFYDSGQLLKIITSQYHYNEVFNEYLISNQEAINLLTFTTGDCYEEVRNTTYSNYRNDCQNKAFSRSKSVEDDRKTLSIYPNPTDKNITITFPSYSLSSLIEVRDLSGKLLVSESSKPRTTSLTMHLDNNPSGIYIVRVIQDKSVLTKKFVKL